MKNFAWMFLDRVSSPWNRITDSCFQNGYQWPQWGMLGRNGLPWDHWVFSTRGAQGVVLSDIKQCFIPRDCPFWKNKTNKQITKLPNNLWRELQSSAPAGAEKLKALIRANTWRLWPEWRPGSQVLEENWCQEPGEGRLIARIFVQ